MTAENIAIAEACGKPTTRKTIFGEMVPYIFSLSDYANDVNAAAEFAKQLASKGWRCRCCNGLDGTWECNFYRPPNSATHKNNIGEMDGETLEIHYGCGDALAIAMCQAGLRAIGKWDSEK